MEKKNFVFLENYDITLYIAEYLFTYLAFERKPWI